MWARKGGLVGMRVCVCSNICSKIKDTAAVITSPKREFSDLSSRGSRSGV